MTTLKLCEDCGNSPKNQRLQEFVVASTRADKYRAFCHVIEFADARGTKVSHIMTYSFALK